MCLIIVELGHVFPLYRRTNVKLGLFSICVGEKTWRQEKFLKTNKWSTTITQAHQSTYSFLPPDLGGGFAAPRNRTLDLLEQEDGTLLISAIKLGTLISLINVDTHLLILIFFHPPRIFPPSTFIDFLDFFHPPLFDYCSYVLVFSKQNPKLHVYYPFYSDFDCSENYREHKREA